MEHEQRPDLFDQLLDFLTQLLIPDWAGLISLIPLIFIVLVVLYVGHTAWQWRRAGRRTRSRVPPRLAAGAPPPGVHLPGPSRWPFVVPIGAALLLFALVLPPRDESGQASAAFNLPLLGLGLLVTAIAVAGWLLDAMHEWRATDLSVDAEAAALTPTAVDPGRRAVPGIAATTSATGGTAVLATAPARIVPAEPPPGVHMPGPSPWPFFAPIGMALVFFGLVLSPALVLGGLVLGVIAAVGWYREASHEYRTTEAVGHPVPKTRDPEVAWPRRLVPIFVAVAALSMVLALLPLGLAWLGSLAPAESGETSAPAVPEVPEITASSVTSFETDTLLVPAGRDFELIFHNQNDGVPHDVAITDGPELNTVFFDGKDITGPDSITYQVPALAEGDHYFLCTIHPNMNGTVQARQAP